VVSTSPDTVTLKWKLPALNGGSEITGYYIERRLDGGDEWTRCNAALFKFLQGQVSELFSRKLAVYLQYS